MPPEMSTNNALAPLQEVMGLGEVLAKSGFFADARSAAQAVVKILAGRELGFGAIASMSGIHIIDGKPSIGAHLMAAKIKGSGKYDYRVIAHDSDRCEIAFLQGDRELGRIAYTIREAVESGIAVGRDGKLKVNWKRTPDDMLFARVISKGYRRYTPDLTGGVTVYDPGELEEVQVIEATATPATLAPPALIAPEPQPAPPPMPVPPVMAIRGGSPDEPILLEPAQVKYVGEALKGKGDYARELLATLGLTRFGEVGQSWWLFVRLCIDRLVKTEYLRDEVLQGLTLPTMNDEQLAAAYERLQGKGKWRNA